MGRNTSAQPVRRYDVLIVGAGFAGSLVAKALGDRGWRILVLEAGADSGSSWEGHQKAVHAFRTALARTPTSPYRTTVAAPSPDTPDLVGGPGGFQANGYLMQRGPLPYASAYVRVNGGTGMVWTGAALRMHPEDFRTGDFGVGRSWPVDYADLEPYYRSAEREIGVAGDVDEQRDQVGLPFADDYTFPMHGLPGSYLDAVIAEALEGHPVRDPYQPEKTRCLDVVGTPQARNGVPNARYDGGAGYTPEGRRCVGYASCMPICPEEAKYTPRRTQERWQANVALETRAVVNRVHAAGNGQITRVGYQSYLDDTTGRHTSHEVEAELVILAAHAIENAKLLLTSGLANRSDQVGRNLMDHPALLTWGLMPEPIGPYRGPNSTSGIESFRFGATRGVRAPFRIEIGNWGWVWALGPPDLDTDDVLREGDPAAPNGRGLFGAELRRLLGDRVGRQFTLQFEVEQEADPDNRLTIDPDELDSLGNPRPVIHYQLSDHVKRGMVAAKRVSDQIFALLQAEDHTDYRPVAAMPGYFEFQGERFSYRGAGHGAGTHIMGSSPTNSVVNQWQQCWDHPNLYAVGCGSMPSLGTSNPSLTMAALALRSAEHMHRELLSRRRCTVR
uniref:Putative glucose-methanol-choline oxidoreductase n=1 Tax=Streptosporangium amethystogenes TaxID=2002 RepID=M4ZQI4_9ACTN|nr:putative glucose-methanol-choline oxidoreductase [Streptosporangium amethystogenes]